MNSFSEKLKEFSLASGADLVGIANIERFKDAPPEMNPISIFPEAKSVVVLGFRIQRGCFRGIEEGTYFNAYPVMGYGYLNMIFSPWVLWQVSNFIEDHGWETVPVQNMNIRNNFGEDGVMLEEPHSRPVAPGRPAPDVQIHSRLAAVAAGLGEIGYSKLLLTPQFGPRQRVISIITDAPLEPDPLYDGPVLCDKCMQCVASCPTRAISKTETVKVTVEDKTFEWGKLDVDKCNIGYQGLVKEDNPFLPEDYPPLENIMEQIAGGRKGSSFRRDNPYQPQYFTHHPGITGGAKGCIRACMMHLEKRGVLKNKFHNPFRKRKS